MNRRVALRPAGENRTARSSPFPQDRAPEDSVEAETESDFFGRSCLISRPWPRWVVSFVAIGSGGFLGANARYGVGLWVAAQWGTGFPWGTLLINVVGSYVLGFYLTLVTERFVGSPTTRIFLATGFLGAFTTFSTFSYETVHLFATGSAAPALEYVTGSLILGLGAAAAGVLCAHAL
jgi:CrcB protein